MDGTIFKLDLCVTLEVTGFVEVISYPLNPPLLSSLLGYSMFLLEDSLRFTLFSSTPLILLDEFMIIKVMLSMSALSIPCSPFFH